jgi:hypothetical protein
VWDLFGWPWVKLSGLKVWLQDWLDLKTIRHLVNNRL